MVTSSAPALPAPDRRLPSGLSPSALNGYLRCERQWARERIDGIASPPSLSTVVGSHVHRVLEVVMSEPPPRRTPVTAMAVHRSISERLRAAVEADEGEATATAGTDGDLAHLADYRMAVTDHGAFSERAAQRLQAYFSMGQPHLVDVAATEQHIAATWRTAAGDVPARGIVDRLDRLPDGRLRAVDYKTGRSPDPRFDDTGYERQILFYAGLLEASTGALPASGLLVYLGDMTALRVDITTDRVEVLREEAGAVWADIAAKFADDAYRPSPSPLCGWCPFVAGCPEGAAEVRARAARGAGRGGLRADAPARAALDIAA